MFDEINHIDPEKELHLCDSDIAEIYRGGNYIIGTPLIAQLCRELWKTTFELKLIREELLKIQNK